MKNRFLRAAASAVLTVLLVLTLLPQRALAAGATLTGTSALLPGDTVTLTLSVPSKVYGLSADLSYSGNLSLSNYNCSVSGWSKSQMTAAPAGKALPQMPPHFR